MTISSDTTRSTVARLNFQASATLSLIPVYGRRAVSRERMAGIRLFDVRLRLAQLPAVSSESNPGARASRITRPRRRRFGGL